MKTPITKILDIKTKFSKCGNDFVVDYYNGSFRYLIINGTYSVQQVSPFTGTIMRTTKESFEQACQYLIDNVSLCGSSFTNWNSDGINGVKYWFDGIYFYRQAFGSFVRSIAVKITKQEFLTACANRF